MAVINVENVTKRYRLGSKTNLREAIMNSLSGLAKNGQNRHGYIKALNQVSFEVDDGEVLGLIGNNGAGKTTALKILSRVTYPTEGKVTTQGRVSGLIELGAGFHPDLTGTENIYLNGSILGLKRSEIDQKFDAIVAFSGLENYLDTPVKRYSSGMYARLAFSVAAHVDPDILLIDEVLSVGDVLFQEKCFKRMKDIKDKGKATIFVSHNLLAIQSICTKVIWLEKGRIKLNGEPEQVIEKYLKSQNIQNESILELEEGEEINSYDNGSISIRNIKICDQEGNPIETISGGMGVKVEFQYVAYEDIELPDVHIHITDKQKTRIIGSELSKTTKNGFNKIKKGEGRISCYFDSSPTRPDYYYFNIDILEKGQVIFRMNRVGPFLLLSDKHLTRYGDYCLFDVESDWSVQMY